MKKVVCIMVVLCLVFVLCACEMDGAQKDQVATKEVAANLAENQPTPTDIDYSLERYNLIKRAYWVNGQREKANMLVCEIEKPLGFSKRLWVFAQSTLAR